MRKTFVYTISAGMGLMLAGRAEVGLLIDPTGGTVLFSDAASHDDEVVTSRSLGFNGHFFGAPVTSVDVSTNGNLNFSAYTYYGNTSFPTGRALIAPLWDDKYIFQGSGQSITEQVSPGNYYAVTWNVSEWQHNADLFTFQAVWFGASTTIGSFQFLPDDIVFNYSTVRPTSGAGTPPSAWTRERAASSRRYRATAMG